MTAKAYEIMTCAEIREILNRRASGEQELMDAIQEIDPSSLYYHTHSYYLHEKYHHDRYPNDFATWTAHQVRDRILGERLSVLDPFTLKNVDALRQELVTIIESHLDVIGYSPRALLGDPFEFVRSHSIVLPTGISVRTREELRKAIETVTADSLYFHFFQDVFGRGRHTGTLVEWVANDLHDETLAARLSGVNPYKLNMERLRAELLDILKEGA
jgi:hypothetical protein